jgi:hypothetical protein
MDSHINAEQEAPLRGDDRTAFLAMSGAAMVSAWVIMSPFFWIQSRAVAFVTATLGLLAWALSVFSLMRPALRWGVALAGMVLAFSGVAFRGPGPAVANHLLCGALLVVLSLAHRQGAAKRATEERLHLLPVSAAARRFMHGLGWGAAATLVMGAFTLLATAVHLWPLAAPVSVLVGRHFFGMNVAAPMVIVLVGLLQLLYGALCGGFLTVLCDPVDLRHALALGALRWMATQVVVFPIVGLADFGLAAGTGPMLATTLPHLVYAVSLGVLMRRDDRRVARLDRPAYSMPS